MTLAWLGRIVRCMDAELDLLHGKILQLAELCRQLRLDNNQLRDTLAAREVENRDLKYKVEETRARIENLLARLPEGSA